MISANYLRELFYMDTNTLQKIIAKKLFGTEMDHRICDFIYSVISKRTNSIISYSEPIYFYIYADYNDDLDFLKEMGIMCIPEFCDYCPMFSRHLTDTLTKLCDYHFDHVYPVNRTDCFVYLININ